MENSRAILGKFSTGGATAQDVHRAVCRDIVDNVQSTRASIWYFNSFHDRVTSACLLDSRTNKFEAGAVLQEDDFPEYFQAIREQNVVNAVDAINHPATRCFDELYFLPNDISSLLDFVITVGNNHVAVLCCEHCGGKRNWSEKDQEYLKQMAILLRLSFLIEQRRLQNAVAA
jgi:GAF domain-containing protein